MGLFAPKGDKAPTIQCMVIGEDKIIMHRKLESTGEYLLDENNLLAYDSFPECIGNCEQVKNGVRKFLGLTSILYENMARPFSFNTLDWIKAAHKEEQVKDGALARGQAKAVQRLDFNDRFDKMQTILLLAVAGVIGLALLFAFSTGLFQKIWS